MFRKEWVAGVMLACGFALAGCSGEAQPAPQAEVTHAPAASPAVTTALSPLPTPAIAASPLAAPAAASLDELVASLQEAGATVETGDKVEEPFFEVQGQALTVNGQRVEVFEWADEAGREAVSRTITPQGQFGTTQVEWVGKPHFWASGKIIALYIGDDSAVIDLLNGALGAPITR